MVTVELRKAAKNHGEGMYLQDVYGDSHDIPIRGHPARGKPLKAQKVQAKLTVSLGRTNIWSGHSIVLKRQPSSQDNLDQVWGKRQIMRG